MFQESDAEYTKAKQERNQGTCYRDICYCCMLGFGDGSGLGESLEQVDGGTGKR